MIFITENEYVRIPCNAHILVVLPLGTQIRVNI